jgi:hypothetical protein
VPVVWIVSETSEDVVKAKVTAMEYRTLVEETKTTAQQLKNGQSGDGKQSSTSAYYIIQRDVDAWGHIVSTIYILFTYVINTTTTTIIQRDVDSIHLDWNM